MTYKTLQAAALALDEPKRRSLRASLSASLRKHTPGSPAVWENHSAKARGCRCIACIRNRKDRDHGKN